MTKNINLIIHALLCLLVLAALSFYCRQHALLGANIAYDSYDALGFLGQSSPEIIHQQIFSSWIDLLVFVPLYTSFLWRLRIRTAFRSSTFLITALFVSDVIETSLLLFCCYKLPFEEPIYFSILAVANMAKLILFGLSVLYLIMARAKQRNHQLA